MSCFRFYCSVSFVPILMMMFLFYCESKVPYINPTWGNWVYIQRRCFSHGLITEKFSFVSSYDNYCENIRSVLKIHLNGCTLMLWLLRIITICKLTINCFRKNVIHQIFVTQLLYPTKVNKWPKHKRLINFCYCYPTNFSFLPLFQVQMNHFLSSK